ncbi:MAG TPA: response regulator transcription factor [Anaerovoracaceae bacterium]|nr:response regulator transcription factor [Bacillota bacterium]HRV32760.1 response regulator transcription factor [Anaerovoracaceae bacterium]
MIYILEDDSAIRELIVYTLEHQNLTGKGFEKPSDFWQAVSEELPQLILLDIMLPQEDGLSVLKRLRSNASTAGIPVILLTAKSSEYDKVTGLDMGADDYVAKPFGMMELLSRIRALLRRTDQASKPLAEYAIENLHVCPAKHQVLVEGREIRLALKEYELLCFLLENRGIVLSRDQILRKIWGYDFDGENRTVDVHIRNLRSKLDTAGDLIRTVRGVGYKLGGSS